MIEASSGMTQTSALNGQFLKEQNRYFSEKDKSGKRLKEAEVYD
jgi:hypothetical protein